MPLAMKLSASIETLELFHVEPALVAVSFHVKTGGKFPTPTKVMSGLLLGM